MLAHQSFEVHRKALFPMSRRLMLEEPEIIYCGHLRGRVTGAEHVELVAENSFAGLAMRLCRQQLEDNSRTAVDLDRTTYYIKDAISDIA